jgi:UDPglucose 6-dehydrogenase
MQETARLYPGQKGLTLCDSAAEAIKGADALAIMTEWQEFRSPDFTDIKAALADAVVFDGRNLYEPSTLERFGLAYYAIGRGRV